MTAFLLALSAPWTCVHVPVCTGINVTDPEVNVSQFLSGKHVVAGELELPPFGFFNATTRQWSGIDIVILDAVAARLNFTYEIRRFDAASADADGNQFLRDTVGGTGQVDFMMSFWEPIAIRHTFVNLIIGHVDISETLITHVNTTADSDGFFQRLKSDPASFLAPFEYDYWAILMIILVVSGLVDYVLERRQGGSPTSSIYEAFAGALWGGFESPRSRLSGLYQVVISFFLLVVISSCVHMTSACRVYPCLKARALTCQCPARAHAQLHGKHSRLPHGQAAKGRNRAVHSGAHRPAQTCLH